MKVIVYIHAKADGPMAPACSKTVSHQVFKYRNAYGLRFHIEVNRAILCHWISSSERDGRLLVEFDELEPHLFRSDRKVLSSFFSRFQRKGPAAGRGCP